VPAGDIPLVLGLALLLLSLPAALSAWADGRAPLAGWGLLLLGAGLVGLGFWLSPGAYTLATLPDAVVRVAARLLNPAFD
jgi:hypothetical protein